MARRWKIFIIVGLVALIADQLTKIWARNSLPTFSAPDGRTYGIVVDVIPNFWAWRLSHNTGVAFGMFSGTSGARIFLSIIGVAAVCMIFWMVHKAREDQTRFAWALGLVGGGAIGNLTDRIAFGRVTDFVVWKYYDKEWPTFNIADVALVLGVGLLFLDMSKEIRAEAAAAKAKKAAAGASGGNAGKKKKKK